MLAIVLQANYAFNPIAGQALRSNQTIVPQRVNAALDFLWFVCSWYSGSPNLSRDCRACTRGHVVSWQGAVCAGRARLAGGCSFRPVRSVRAGTEVVLSCRAAVTRAGSGFIVGLWCERARWAGGRTFRALSVVRIRAGQ